MKKKILKVPERKFKYPSNILKFIGLSNFKKFKKNKAYKGWSKKEKKEAWYYDILDILPYMISFDLKYGHRPEAVDSREALYLVLTDKYFVKQLTKNIKNEEVSFKNIELLPLIIGDLVKKTQLQEIEENKANDSDKKVTYDMSDLVKLSKLILKGKLKKFTKNEIDENLAFDILSVIPDNKILSPEYDNNSYHAKEFFNVLYKYAKDNTVDFDKIMKLMFKHQDSTEVKHLFVLSLLEKKEMFVKYNDKQKELYNKITNYIFNTIEKYDSADIMSVIKTYSEARDKDKERGIDTNRRYYLYQLPQVDYPNIIKCIDKLVKSKPQYKEYF